MIERNVAYHKWHVVSGPVGGTVTNEDGTVTYCTIPEGGQGHFFAVTTKVWVSEETVELDQDVNFKGAGAKLRLLGAGENSLPAGYLRADFLESTGTQYIDTLLVPDSSSEARLSFAVMEAVSWSAYYGSRVQDEKSFYCRNNNTDLIVNVHIGSFHSGAPYELKKKNELIVHASTSNFELNGKSFSVKPSEVNTTRTAYLFAHSGSYTPHGSSMRCWAFDISNSAQSKRFIPALASGVPCMFETTGKTPHGNIGTGQFIVGLTLEQARKLGKYLPEGGGSLTVSLPCEAQLVQSNAEVEASLQTAKSKGWTITVQYREPEEDSVLNTKYAECETAEDLRAVNADYKNDVTADGVWRWKLTKLTDGAFVFYGAAVKSFPAGFSFPALTKAGASGWASGMFRACTVAFDNPRAFPALTDANRMFHEAYVTLPENMDFSHVTTAVGIYNGANLKTSTFPGFWTALKDGTHLTRNSRSSIFSRLMSGFPSLQTGSEMFPYSRFDKDSALLLLNSLPAHTSGSHPLQVGIHVDHQADEDVINAIAEAEAKGWTLTVSWNGTATAAAASTWGRRKTVFAQLGEPNEDGTPHLVWGHYVTNWEENGYQEFGSLEEAKEHFNIGE